MFLLKTRQNIGSISHLVRWSSSISDKAGQELLEKISKQDKILTDEFREKLPLIREMEKKKPRYKLDESDKKLLQPPFSNEMTNILDPTPETTEITVTGSNAGVGSGEKTSISNQMVECPSTNSALEDEEPPPKSLPVIISAFGRKRSGFQWDLTTASLPISLHRGEDNFLTVAVTKDIRHAYFKTLETTGYCWMLVQQQGALVGKIVGLPVERGEIGSITRERALVLIEKSSLWLADPKATPGESKTEGSLVDSIKKGIERILTLIKAKLEDQKKASEKKKEEAKKEEVKKAHTDKVD